MGIFSSKKLAAVIAGAAVFVFFIFFLPTHSLGWTATYAALISLFIFLVAWYASEHFIYKKLFSSIHRFRYHKNGKKDFAEFSDPTLREIFSELEGWASDRKEEIEQLKKLELYRKEYLGNVSHELKTPIFNIQGYVSTLLDGGLEDKSINLDYLQRAMRSVDRMIAIVEDLQTITQLEKGELEIDEEDFDIIALAKEVVEAEEMRAREKKITLELMNDTVHPVMVCADKFRIRQVIVNLIVNSVRYGKENGRTSIKVADGGEKVVVEVADTGIGIPKEHLPRVFERFYRVDKSRSREQGGTGLGLAIVKHILEAHGENIDVRSTEGVGSVFSFTLKKASTG